jgi:hypothetical protein
VFLLRLGDDRSMFIYRCPVPGERRAGDGNHVEGEFAVVSTVEDKKGDDGDDDERS